MIIDELYELQENGFLNEVDSLKVSLLLQSINDWPNTVIRVEDFLEQVSSYLNIQSITYESLEKAIKRLSLVNSSWEIESLTSLLELMKMFKDQRLSKVLADCKII